MSKKVLMAIADGSEDIESVVIIDVLRRAGADVTVASVGQQQITAARGTRIVADAVIDQCAGVLYDMIVLPGGMPGAENLRDSATLTGMLTEQRDAGRYYAAICAAPVVVLKAHGLLDGKQATCYPSMQDQLPNPAPAARVVVDDNLVTSEGPGTAMDFSVKLVELLFGAEKAEKIAEDLLAK